jgi:hypothetical protein
VRLSCAIRSGSARKSSSTILAVPDRDGGNREGFPVEEGDHPGGAVDERPPHSQVDARPHERLPGDGFRALKVLQ